MATTISHAQHHRHFWGTLLLPFVALDGEPIPQATQSIVYVHTTTGAWSQTWNSARRQGCLREPFDVRTSLATFADESSPWACAEAQNPNLGSFGTSDITTLHLTPKGLDATKGASIAILSKRFTPHHHSVLLTSNLPASLSHHVRLALLGWCQRSVHNPSTPRQELAP